MFVTHKPETYKFIIAELFRFVKTHSKKRARLACILLFQRFHSFYKCRIYLHPISVYFNGIVQLAIKAVCIYLITVLSGFFCTKCDQQRRCYYTAALPFYSQTLVCKHPFALQMFELCNLLYSDSSIVLRNCRVKHEHDSTHISH